MYTSSVTPIDLDTTEATTAASNAALASSNDAIASNALSVSKLQTDVAMLNSIAKKPHIGVTTSNSTTSASNDMPPVPKGSKKIPDWFNPNVPSKYMDPYLYPGDDDLSKLYRMMEWMKDNPGETAAAQPFIEYVANLINQGLLSKSELKELLIDKAPHDSSGESIFNAAIDILIQQKYYATGQEDESDFFTYLKTLFGGDDALSKSICDNVDDWKVMWKSWLKVNEGADGKPIHSYDDFNVIASGYWGKFLNSSNILEWQRDYRMIEIDALKNNPTLKNNLMLFAMLILFMLSDSSSADELEGYGTTAKWLKERTDDIAEIQKEWSTGFKTADDATAFIKHIKDLIFQVDNSPLAGDIKDALESNLNTILDQPTSVADPTDPTKFLTVGQLYDSKSDKLMAELNKFEPPTDPSAKVPTQYQTILNALKSGAQGVTDQSQVTTTEMSSLTSHAEANTNMINKCLNDDSGIIGAQKAAVQNQKPS